MPDHKNNNKGEKIMNQKLSTKNHTSQKGITLIALVVTIIVMLILTAVTINMVTGDESVIKQAKSSRDKQEEGKDLEIIKTAVSAQNMELAMSGGVIDRNYLSAVESEIEKKLGPATVVASADGRSLTVTIEEDPENRTYPITLGDGNEVIVSTATPITTQPPTTVAPTNTGIIEFTVSSGYQYQCLYGMTWAEFIGSEYNYFEGQHGYYYIFEIIENEVGLFTYLYGTKYMPVGYIEYNSARVVKTDSIIEGADYSANFDDLVIAHTISFSINGVSYTVLSNHTWVGLGGYIEENVPCYYCGGSISNYGGMYNLYTCDGRCDTQLMLKKDDGTGAGSCPEHGMSYILK